MYTELQLKAMNAAEQKKYAKDIGVELKGNLNEDTVIARILERQAEPDFIDPFDPEHTDTPPQAPELKGTDFLEPSYTFVDGATKTRQEVLMAVYKESGMTEDQWNKQSDNQVFKRVDDFIQATNFIPTVPEEETPTPPDKGHTKRIEKALEPYTSAGLNLEIEDNFYTMSYGMQTQSGNIANADRVIKREADILLRNNGIVV